MNDMDFRHRYWKYSLITLIVVIGLILFAYSVPFINGILIALTIFILLRSTAVRLSAKIGSTRSAIVLTIGTILFIFIPIALLVWLLIDQISSISWNPQALMEPVNKIYEAIDQHLNILDDPIKYIQPIAEKITSWGQGIFTGIGNFFLDISVAVVVFFFLVKSRETIEKYIREILPFNRRNVQNVIGEINTMVRSNAIGIPLLALIQGIISWGGYMIFHVPNPLVFALVTAIASVIPVVGTALIWIPLSVYLFVIGDWQNGIGLLAFGVIVISQSDNLIRFILQKKMADTHPLITLFGVLIGVPIFGFMGLIFGPLLISLFLLFIDIFKTEYLNSGKEDTAQEPTGRIAIFDLDGTLINSLQDIANAANHALEINGYPTHTLEEINSYVGNGIRKLMERALPESARTDAEIDKVKAAFTDYYNIHNTDFTVPYPGIMELLKGLNRSGVKIAVASNKYDAAAKVIVRKCFPEIEFAAVYGQLDNVRQKPAPDIVHKICRENRIELKDVIYIGDSDVDMMTGANAGVTTIGVTWGFRPEEKLKEFNPRYIVHQADEILNICLK